MPIRRYDKDYHFIGIVTDDESEELAFCEVCQRSGELSKLKERIYLDDNGKLLPPPPGSENFRQCWTCGTVVKLRDVKYQGKISGIQGIEIIDNPYDQKKGVILGNDSKNRYHKLKQRRNRPTHQDKEVQKLIDQGWELKEYKTSMPV